MKKISVSLLVIVFCAGVVHSLPQVKRPVQKRIQAVKSIKVLYPNGGERWEIGNPYTIRWQSQGIAGFVKIKLKWGTGSGGWFTVTNKTTNNGIYRYTVPASGMGQRGNQFKVYVMSLDESVNDASDRDFTILQERQGIRPVPVSVKVKFTEISRLDELDSPSKLQIKELEKLAEAKSLQQNKIIEGWKNLNKKLIDRKKLLQDDVIKESFNKQIQKTKNQAQVFKKRAALAAEAERRMDKELKRARQYLRQIKASRTASTSLPPFKGKVYTDIVRRIKAGQTSIQWDPGEMPIKSASEVTLHIQQIEAQVDSVRNKRQEFTTEFENFDQKCNQLFNLLATVMKSTREMRLAALRNLL